MLSKKLQPRLLTIAAHILFWLTLTCFYYISNRITGRTESFWSSTAIVLPLDLLVVYVTAYFLVPRYLLTQKLRQFALLFVVSVFIFLIIERAAYYYVVYPYIFDIETQSEPFFFFPSFFGIFLGTYSFVFLFCGVRLFRGWLKDKQRQMELEQQTLESELKMLRSQVNPHFIFNTLNNIDSLVYIDQERASDAIVRLSEIMRYMLYESNTELVSLEKEVYYLECMIDLIRLRLKDPNFIQFNLEGDIQGLAIPPMLLVPFVENAYKHGRKSGPCPGIVINLKINKTSYQFEVINEYNSNYDGPRDSLGGIGLSNVERRLKLIFPNEHDFYINNTSPTFQIYVEIPARSFFESQQATPHFSIKKQTHEN
jgi:sensor histidine kinase YesM